MLLLILPIAARSQQYADTLPLNKNAIIEEFTGVKCPYCPAAHILLDSILNENPGRVFAVAMHPANAPALTAPYTGSPDFRRTFPNAFFSIPFATDSVKFMPGAFINRRQWDDGRREQYTFHWRRYTDTILHEPSPVNVGLFSSYDLLSQNLYVTVEVFYTDTLQQPHTLYVFLTEDSLISQQANGGTNYVHNHVFRESLTAQWGDTVISSGLPGSLYSANFVYNNSITLYNIFRCNIIAFLRNAVTEEIITGIGKTVDDFLTSVNKNTSAEAELFIFPNPAHDVIYLKLFPAQLSSQVRIYNSLGQITSEYNNYRHNIEALDISALQKGIYLIEVIGESTLLRKTFIKR